MSGMRSVVSFGGSRGCNGSATAAESRMVGTVGTWSLGSVLVLRQVGLVHPPPQPLSPTSRAFSRAARSGRARSVVPRSAMAGRTRYRRPRPRGIWPVTPWQAFAMAHLFVEPPDTPQEESRQSGGERRLQYPTH